MGSRRNVNGRNVYIAYVMGSRRSGSNPFPTSFGCKTTENCPRGHKF